LIYRSLGKKEEALKLNEQALQKMEESAGPYHPNLVRALSNLGVAYLDAGRFEESDRAFRRAVQIAEDRLGPNHPDVATVLLNYSTLLDKTKRKSEARATRQRSKGILSGFANTHSQASTVDLRDLK
jgi:tetratricopeptide (TPR) repeat protein